MGCEHTKRDEVWILSARSNLDIRVGTEMFIPTTVLPCIHEISWQLHLRLIGLTRWAPSFIFRQNAALLVLFDNYDEVMTASGVLFR